MSNVLEMALEALEAWTRIYPDRTDDADYHAIAALKEALRNQDALLGRCCYGGLKTKDQCGSCAAWEALKNQGEPVAYLHRWVPDAPTIGKSLHFTETSPHGDAVAVTPLYTSAPTIPEGWQLVPKEPTEEMHDIGAAHSLDGFSCAGIYKAMLSAAPEYKGDHP